MKKTPKKQETVLARKPKAGLRLRVLFGRLSPAGEDTVRRSFSRALWRTAGKGILLLALCGLLTLSLVLTVSPTMERITTPAIVTVDTIPDTADYDCILVLGAGVRADGTPATCSVTV